MIRIKVYRLTQLIYYLLLILLIAAVLFFTYRLVIGKPVSPQDVTTWAEESETPLSNEGTAYQSVLKMGYPVLSAGTGKSSSFFTRLWGWVSSKSFKDPRTIITAQMPFLVGIQPQEEGEEEVLLVSRSGMIEPHDDIPLAVDDAEAPAVDEPEVILAHDPKVPEEIKIEIAKIKDDLPPIQVSGEGPQLLIYHSHSREAYKQDSTDKYQAVGAFRSTDPEYTVTQVGSVLTYYLQQEGIPVLHDTTEHEQDNFLKSYSRSLETIQNRMAEYDSLKVFIDLHRNAYDSGAKKADDEVVMINGERVAKLMFVVGTGEGVAGGFKDKPNWKENYKLASRLTNIINEKYPGLVKPVWTNTGRYNQHVSTKAILVEVGSNYTTLKEAERAAKYLAEGIAEIVD